jgi:CRP-like cAMP-binding protein
MLEVFKTYLREKTQMSEEQFERLSPFLLTREIKKNTIIIRQGDTFSKMIFVTKGLLRSYTIDNKDKQHVVDFAPEQYWIGDQNSFKLSKPSAVFIEAVEDAAVILMDRDFYETAGKIAPGYNAFMVSALLTRLSLMQRRINMLLAATAEERYLEFMELFPDVMSRVPLWMVATHLGMTAESLSRVRKELATKKAVRS